MAEYDDFRQSFVVMKNEFIKFVRGKKVLLFLGLMALILALMTIMPYIFGSGLSKVPAETIYVYTFFASWIVLLSASLFASSAIVSEYEERTALILFTKPIKKWSIFVGKFFASVIMGIVFITIYYAFTALVSFVVAGGVEGALLSSFGLAVLYNIPACGVAMLISSVMKKSSTSTMMAFVILLLILPLFSMLMSTSVDTWWMLDQAGGAIKNVIPSIIGGILMTSMTSFEVLRAAGVMLAWGAVSSVVAYAIFRKRDF